MQTLDYHVPTARRGVLSRAPLIASGISLLLVLSNFVVPAWIADHANSGIAPLVAAVSGPLVATISLISAVVALFIDGPRRYWNAVAVLISLSSLGVFYFEIKFFLETLPVC